MKVKKKCLTLVGYIHPRALDRLKTGDTVAFRKKPYKIDGGFPVYVDLSKLTTGENSDILGNC